MTESEAIKKLKDIFGECTESEEAVCYITNIDASALEMAINALEKQITKKPTKDKYVLELDFCPECGTEVTYCNYCPHCGQKINWNE